MQDYEKGARYFLQMLDLPEQEVTREQFITAERNAGFRPKYGDGLATGGFSSGTIRGRVQYTPLTLGEPFVSVVVED